MDIVYNRWSPSEHPPHKWNIPSNYEYTYYKGKNYYRYYQMMLSTFVSLINKGNIFFISSLHKVTTFPRDHQTFHPLFIHRHSVRWITLFGYVTRQPLSHYNPTGGCQVFYTFYLTYPGIVPPIYPPVHPMGVSPLPYMCFSTQKPPTIP